MLFSIKYTKYTKYTKYSFLINTSYLEYCQHQKQTYHYIYHPKKSTHSTKIIIFPMLLIHYYFYKLKTLTNDL